MFFRRGKLRGRLGTVKGRQQNSRAWTAARCPLARGHLLIDIEVRRGARFVIDPLQRQQQWAFRRERRKAYDDWTFRGAVGTSDKSAGKSFHWSASGNMLSGAGGSDPTMVAC